VTPLFSVSGKTTAPIALYLKLCLVSGCRYFGPIAGQRFSILIHKGGHVVQFFRTKTLVFLIGLSIATLQPGDCRAQSVDSLISLGTATIGAFTVKKIFSDIQQTLDQAQKAVEASGNRMVATGVEQSYIMLKQLQQDLNDDLDKTFNSISDQRKLVIFDLYTAANQLVDNAANAFAAEQVQIDKALAEVRFIGKDVGFLIIRVFPSLFLKDIISSTPIQIYGVGFGTDQGDKQFKTSVSVAGAPLDKADIELKEWGIQLNLGHLDQTALFKASEFNHVPLVISTNVTGPGGWWCSWAGCKSLAVYSATYHVDFYPTDPAHLIAKQQDEVLVGNGKFDSTEILAQLPDMNNAHHLADTPTQVTYAGDGWRWERYDPTHDRAVNAGNIDGVSFVRNPSCRFFNDNTQAQCAVSNDGGPVHYYFSVVRQQYIKKANSLPDVSLSLTPGETKRIEIQTAATSAWIEGTLPTGQTVGPISLKPPGGAALAPIICTSAGNVGDKSAFDCQMPNPQ
jgi:hypothetical protein